MTTPLDDSLSPRWRRRARTPRACAGSTGWRRRSCSCCWKRRPRATRCARASSRWRTGFRLRLRPGGTPVGFAGEAAPYASLSGRALSGMLAGQGLGLAVNLGTGAEMLLDPDAVDWLAEMLATRPDEVEEAPRRDRGSRRLARGVADGAGCTAGLGGGAGAAGGTGGGGLRGGRQGHLLAFIDAVPGPSRRWRGWWARR
jgi:hypothetical protein